MLPTFQCLTLIAFAAVSLQVGRKALLLQQQVTCRTVQIDTHKHTTIIEIREKRQVSVCCPPCASSNSPSVWATGSWAHHRRSTVAARGHSRRESAAAAAGPPAAAACGSSRHSSSRQYLSASAPTPPAQPPPPPSPATNGGARTSYSASVPPRSAAS